jgi:hypothetical protein
MSRRRKQERGLHRDSILMFRCTDKERAQVQSLADKYETSLCGIIQMGLNLLYKKEKML